MVTSESRSWKQQQSYIFIGYNHFTWFFINQKKTDLGCESGQKGTVIAIWIQDMLSRSYTAKAKVSVVACRRKPAKWSRVISAIGGGVGEKLVKKVEIIKWRRKWEYMIAENAFYDNLRIINMYPDKLAMFVVHVAYQQNLVPSAPP